VYHFDRWGDHRLGRFGSLQLGNRSGIALRCRAQRCGFSGEPAFLFFFCIGSPAFLFDRGFPAPTLVFGGSLRRFTAQLF
jgi:hypothetical protein